MSAHACPFAIHGQENTSQHSTFNLRMILQKLLVLQILFSLHYECNRLRTACEQPPFLRALIKMIANFRSCSKHQTEAWLRIKIFWLLLRLQRCSPTLSALQSTWGMDKPQVHPAATKCNAHSLAPTAYGVHGTVFGTTTKFHLHGAAMCTEAQFKQRALTALKLRALQSMI